MNRRHFSCCRGFLPFSSLLQALNRMTAFSPMGAFHYPQPISSKHWTAVVVYIPLCEPAHALWPRKFENILRSTAISCPTYILTVSLNVLIPNMATSHKPTTINLADINQKPANILRRVLFTILHNKVVKDIFAQVIDGLPIARTYQVAIARRFELLSRPHRSR